MVYFIFSPSEKPENNIESALKLYVSFTKSIELVRVKLFKPLY